MFSLSCKTYANLKAISGELWTRVVCQVGVTDEAEEEEAVVFSTHPVNASVIHEREGIVFPLMFVLWGDVIWQNKTMNFVAFYQKGGGRTKRKAYFDVYNKQWNSMILEFERNLNLGWLSKYAFEQVFNDLTQENGNSYTSCHFGASQQHCICCIPWNFFF